MAFLTQKSSEKNTRKISLHLDSLQRSRGQLGQDPREAVGKEYREEEPPVTAFVRLSHGAVWGVQEVEWLVNGW